MLANSAYYGNGEVPKLTKDNVESDSPTARLQMIGKALQIVGAEEPYRPPYTHKTFGTFSEKYVFPTFSNWTMWFLQWALDVKLAK